MHPSPAELARTLTHGRLPGVIRVAHRPAAVPVHHATDPSGRPLVLVRDDSDLGRLAAEGPTGTLTVRDRPPLPDSPRWGRVLLAGRLRRLVPDAAAEQALMFAEANPVGDLLDVGFGSSLYVIDVGRIRHFGRSGAADIDPDAYAAAGPDPLHEHERDLLLDLNDHHVPQITSYFRELLDAAGRPYGPRLRAARLDRYGFLVNLDHEDAGTRTQSPPHGRLGPRFARLSFGRPVRCRHELARKLGPVLFRSAHGEGTSGAH